MRHRLGKVQRNLLLAMRVGERFGTRQLAGYTAGTEVLSHSQLMSVARALRSLHALGLIKCWCARRTGEAAWEVIGFALPAGRWVHEWELTPEGQDEVEWIRTEVKK